MRPLRFRHERAYACRQQFIAFRIEVKFVRKQLRPGLAISSQWYVPDVQVANAWGFLRVIRDELVEHLLFPGLLPRRDSIARAGTEAVRLLVGTIPILIIAGTIEGFISPSGLPARWKFVLAAAIATIFFLYLFLPAEKKKEDTATAATAS